MKPHVRGLKDSDGTWKYVAWCDKCDWSLNWDGSLNYDWVLSAAIAHYYLYADTKRCYAG